MLFVFHLAIDIYQPALRLCFFFLFQSQEVNLYLGFAQVIFLICLFLHSILPLAVYIYRWIPLLEFFCFFPRLLITRGQLYLQVMRLVYLVRLPIFHLAT